PPLMPHGLPRFVFRRLLLAVPVFIGVTLVTFVLMYVVPGDPVTVMVEEKMASTDPTAARLFREKWGLNDPLALQYLKFLWNATRGDLGLSYRSEQPVLESILERFPATATLAAAALAIAVLIGIPLGVLAALRQNTALDAAAISLATFGVSIPNFWLGLLLIYFIAVELRWLPPSGYGPAYPYLILPAVTLGTGLSAVIARLTRSSLLEVIRQDYIRTARAKGLAERRVILWHALRNAAIPIVTIIGVQSSGLLSGAVITERVFSWPGVGRLLIDAIGARDLPIVQGCVLFIATVFILLNLLVDLSYAWLDPRIRYE
ncbi:MAG TPA: nickel ABC transporter permease, partial [bacterium]|nr:nickel ABC transporter permease [bacterium]